MADHALTRELLEEAERNIFRPLRRRPEKLPGRRFQLHLRQPTGSRLGVLILTVYGRDPLVSYYYLASYQFGERRTPSLAEAVRAAVRRWRRDRRTPHFRALSEAPRG